MKVFHLLLLLIVCRTANAQSSTFENKKTVAQTITAINQQLGQFHQQKTLDQLLQLYHSEITFCPEYKPAILNKKRLQQFFADWWRINTIQSYQKTIYEIQSFGEFILEDGHFLINYMDKTGTSKQYGGMYLVIWKREVNGQLRILSEGFCSDSYREASEMPYANVEVIEQLDYPQKVIPELLKKKVHIANDALIRTVGAGDSEARIAGFTEDAIYLHHFEKMMVGMEVLDPYLRKTYTPEAEIFVEHQLGRIYDLGAYVLVNGHYRGGWSMHGGGTFEGNFIKVQRKENDGSLKTYRSWTNNDR